MFSKYSKRISLFHYLFPLDVAYLPKSTLNLNPIRNPCCLPPIFPSLSSACLISYLDKLHRNSCFFFPKSMTLRNNSDSLRYVLGKWGVTKHYYSLLELTSISNSQFSPHTSDFPRTWSFWGPGVLMNQGNLGIFRKWNFGSHQIWHRDSQPEFVLDLQIYYM